MSVPPGRQPVAPAIRHQVLVRAGNRCEDCGDWPAAEMHHLRYWYQPWPNSPWAHEREPIWGHETTDDLAGLCRNCHYNRHYDTFGEKPAFWADPEEREEFYAGWYWAMAKDD